MPINRQFGRDLSEKLINGAFAGARRDIEITQVTSFDPINETEATVVYNGKCIRTGLNGASYGNQSILDAEFTLKVKASEVPFEVRQDDCQCKVQDLDPVTDADLGMVSCEILAVMKDGVDAVYTIVAKRS
jgi:hypothetical protein